MAERVSTIDEYIASCPEAVQPKLREVRHSIRTAAPEAEETISYQIPTFSVGGRHLVYFGAWKHHIGMYPVPHDEDLEPELEPYRSGKGTLKFPLSEPMPLDLIQKVVSRLSQHLNRE